MKTYVLILLLCIAFAVPVLVFGQQVTPSGVAQSTLAQIFSKRSTPLKTGGYNGSFVLNVRGVADSKNYSGRINGTFDGIVYSKNNQSIDAAEGTYSLGISVDNTLQRAFGVTNESVTFQVKSILESYGKYGSYFRITSGSTYVQKLVEQYRQILKLKTPLMYAWIKLPQSSNLYGSGSTYSAPVSYQTKYTPAEQALIIQKFANMLDVVADKGVEQVNTYMGRHFVLSLTPEKFKQFVIDVAPITSKQQLSTGDINELNSLTQDATFRDFLAKTKFNLWIGENDGKIYKLTTETSEINIVKGKDPVYISYVLDINLKDVPATYKVVKPTKFIDYNTIYQKQLSEAQTKAKDAMIKATIANLNASAELFYSANNYAGYKGFCTSKDIVRARTSISSHTTLVCRDSETGFSAYAKITKGYFCADSSSSSKVITKIPSAKKTPSCL